VEAAAAAGVMDLASLEVIEVVVAVAVSVVEVDLIVTSASAAAATAAAVEIATADATRSRTSGRYTISAHSTADKSPGSVSAGPRSTSNATTEVERHCVAYCDYTQKYY
jgi:hypothetical protein